jgi:predicted DNA-binding protein
MSVEPDPISVSLRIDSDIQQRIETYARAVGATPQEIIRQAFEEYQATHNAAHTEEISEEVVSDILSRAGLIGCVKSKSRTPTDLSTNPKHMQGFGRA